MKKIIFILLTFSISALSYAQIEIDSQGKVGIGGISPTTRLHIQDDYNTVIKLNNGNDYSWSIGSYKSNIWSIANTFTISDDTGYPKIDIRPGVGVLINDKLVVGVGWGIVHRDYTSAGGNSQASGYDFNPTKDNSRVGFIFENTAWEGSGFYGDEDYAVIWSPGDGYLLKVLDEDGMPYGSELKWYLNGSGVAYSNSDITRKTNIESIESSIKKIKDLRGVRYNFIKTEEENLKNDSIINGLVAYAGDIEHFKQQNSKNNYGFIAQELEEIIPEVVETDESGNKFVNYDGIIPLLVEGMKEQQLIIESLQSIIASQEEDTNIIKKMLGLSADIAKNEIEQIE